MRPLENPRLHLTYCQNIHPGERWVDNHAALSQKAVAVRDALGWDGPFGLGLRLGATAASELGSAEAIAEGSALFASENMYPFSINGFPYGRFHNGPVKENVYAPDWRTPERFSYTAQLAEILAKWLGEGMEGSISTVPGSFAPWIQNREEELSMARNLGALAVKLAQIEAHTGRRIHLGLEPEPDCFLETTAQTLAFFADALPAGAVPVLRHELQVGEQRALELLHRHLGVCFDTCHVALQYEDLAASLRAYRSAGVLISKIQLSAALKAPFTPEAIEALGSFREPTYLHQIKARGRQGSRKAWTDLPEGLRALPQETDLEELRVHFHVPLFVSPKAPLASTADALDDAFWQEVLAGVCPHVEIETYTFDVLPPEVHPGDIVQSIAAEYRWVLGQLAGASLSQARPRSQ
jgi:sugar phosphate isomerase/epimerase